MLRPTALHLSVCIAYLLAASDKQHHSSQTFTKINPMVTNDADASEDAPQLMDEKGVKRHVEHM